MSNLLTKGYTSNFKLAVVVDIILDESHPYFSKEHNQKIASEIKNVYPDQIPVNYNNDVADKNDIDYSVIGRAKVRIIDTEIRISTSRLRWALPLTHCFTQYPLLNECVLVIEMGEYLYYTNSFNQYNFPTANPSYKFEIGLNAFSRGAIPSSFVYNNEDANTLNNKQSYLAPPSITTVFNSGFLGERFILNPYIRTLKRFEGDTTIESRFGQSIRFGAYDNTDNDCDIELESKLQSRKDTSYSLNALTFPASSAGGFGNPTLTIRNRQRNLSLEHDLQYTHKRLPAIPKISDKEKNFGGQIEEDINNDGSTIELNSGIRVTKWITSCYKSMFGITEGNVPTEEQVNYNPAGATNFIFPRLCGDQITINSDRLIFSSRLGETFHFSKRRYGIVTDNEFTIDANDQIVMTTNRVACINAPQIFLGQYGETNEPAVLGQTAVDWLYDLCNWLLNHVHWYNHVHPYPHSHPDAGGESPRTTINSENNQTQAPVQQAKLKLLRDNLHKMLSRRVFLVGGGYASGSDGIKPEESESDCLDPIKINTVSGDGVLGDFKGKNRRENPKPKKF